MSLIPECKYCHRSLMFFRESNGKIYSVDRYTGERHDCVSVWKGINTALDHFKPYGRKSVQWSASIDLLSRLRKGPVFQHEIGYRCGTDLLSYIRRVMLKDSGMTIEGYWCCPVDSKVHYRERVYQLGVTDV